ncbi:MAG: hypothetical protein IH594_16120 [Bacteroidales bacterium]|nr:hypothetical protein [Bacteroidales bacterium]
MKSKTGLLSKKAYISLIILVISVHTGLKGQSPGIKEVFDTASIEQQFTYIFERSSRYEEYKVIREAWLNQYRKNLNDTIQGVRKMLDENNKIISTKNQEIESLKSSLSATREDLDKAIKEKNSFVFFGIKIAKTFYNLIMWILVAGLIFMLVIVFLMYKRSNVVTRETVSNLDRLQKESEEYRNQSRLKMEKIKREHLDELLKLKSGQ